MLILYIHFDMLYLPSLFDLVLACEKSAWTSQLQYHIALLTAKLQPKQNCVISILILAIEKHLSCK